MVDAVLEKAPGLARGASVLLFMYMVHYQVSYSTWYIQRHVNEVL